MTTAGPPPARSAWTLLSGLLVALSPFAFYWAFTRHELQTAGWLVVGWISVRLVPVLLAARPEHRRAALQLPLLALGFALLGAFSQQRLLMLSLPALSQLGFAWAFARTLRAGQTPLIEHFARMQKPALERDEQAHCRQFTRIWAGALLISAGISATLAAIGPLWLWALFSGALSYAATGVLLVLEYLVRAARFRRLGDNWLQRRLHAHFPDRSPLPEEASWPTP